MGFSLPTGMSDESLQKALVLHFEKVRRSAVRMNAIGAELVSRGILAGYEKMYYPNIWNHGQRQTA